MAPTTKTVPPAASSARPLAVAWHVRSASVPCHTHPLADVDDQLLALRSWTSNPGPKYPLSLAHVRALLCVLDELLRLPLAQAALSRSAGTADSDGLLLDGFLVLADAFGMFLAALVALRQHAAELRAAVRRPDSAKLASAARAQRQAGRKLEQLAAAVAREAGGGGMGGAHAEAAEVARAVAEAVNDTAAAAAAVFLEVGAVANAAAALASPASASPKKSRLLPLSRSRQRSVMGDGEERREGAALEKLQELEQCVRELESESEKVFRSLVQTRVSLLNIHTRQHFSYSLV
ncbi:unnamed protein product [Miscanthus lutarioriparius]|uniref:Uncharacterized protein n=1 Tax=Miscanthus lutarioriparius TaxID=422564 RepID=A0A811SAC2_9POAL|nr:unnamed protein product [Miscanthus lutarioriparius]